MTEILELAKQAGFIKQDMSLAHEAIEKNVYLVPSDSHLREFASILREKFTAELGESVAEFRHHFSTPKGTKEILCISLIDEMLPLGTQLYALPKDKD